MPSSRTTQLLRLAVVPAIVLAALLIAWRLGYFRLEQRQQLSALAHRVRQLPGTEGLYVAFYAVSIALVLPATIPSVVGGALFGWGKGAILAWFGALAGTVLSHQLARRVARTPMRRLFGEHRLLRRLKDSGSVIGLLRLRILPVTPFATLDYVCGVAGVSLWRLLLATMIGFLPSAVAYTYVGAEVMRGISAGSPTSHRALWIAAAVTVAMMLLSAVPAVMQRRRA